MTSHAQVITQPSVRGDGSVDSVVRPAQPGAGGYTFLELAVPTRTLEGNPLGRFVLARCGDAGCADHRRDWSIPLRRCLHITGLRHIPDLPDAVCLRLLVPTTLDAGYDWLREIPAGTLINVLGPYGREIRLPNDAHHLLLVSTKELAPLLLPAVEQALDRNVRVTMILRDQSANPDLLSLLPLPVEVQATQSQTEWLALIDEGVPWADAMIICDAALSPQGWADAIRDRRLFLNDDFAQIWMPAAYLCGTGACMACVVARSNGSLTRACINGPFFPLTSLVR